MSGGKRKRKIRIPERQAQPSAEKLTKFNIRRALKLFGGALSVVLAISGILPLIGGPSVQSPVPLGRNNPLSLLFEVTNESPLPIFGVKSYCEIDANTEHNIGIFDSIVGIDLSDKSAVFGRGKFTVDCAAFNTGDPIELPARVSLLISYRHFIWPFQWQRKYSFTARKQDDGSARWLPD